MKYDKVSNETLLSIYNGLGNHQNNDDETTQIYKRVKEKRLFVKWNYFNNALLSCEESDPDILN